MALVPAGLYLLFILLPVAALVHRGWTEGGLGDALGRWEVQAALRLSLVTSLASAGIIALVGTPLAYMLARRRSRGWRLVDSLVELPLVFPPVVAGLAMLMAFGRRGIVGGWLASLGIFLPFTTVAVVFAQLFVSAPFYIRAARLGFQGVDLSYEELSRTLGDSPWRTFRRVTLPLAWPSLVAGLVLAWARAIAEFGATIMFAGNYPGRTQTMPLAILSAMESDLGAALGLAIILAGLSVLVLVGLGFLTGFGSRQP